MALFETLQTQNNIKAREAWQNIRVHWNIEIQDLLQIFFLANFKKEIKEDSQYEMEIKFLEPTVMSSGKWIPCKVQKFGEGHKNLAKGFTR